MMYTQDNVLYVHNYSDFMRAQAQSTAIKYTDFCFREKLGMVSFVVKNVLRDYIYELKRVANLVTLTSEDIKKYKYKPKLMSADLYGSTEYYYIILMLNGMYDQKDFVNIENLYLLTKTQLNEALSEIYSSESANIKMYNSVHNV